MTLFCGGIVHACVRVLVSITEGGGRSERKRERERERERETNEIKNGLRDRHTNRQTDIDDKK